MISPRLGPRVDAIMDGAAVKLIIKAPNQRIKDQAVSCDVGWTVARLKQHLADVYPTKPESRHQKLIYSGQLLNDAARLKDVLRRHDDGADEQVHTVHLVCAPQKSQVDEARAPAPETRENVVSAAGEVAEASRSSEPPVQPQESTRNVEQPAATQVYSVQYFDPRNSQQMAWMQQAYTHYFAQYMQLMAAQGIQLHTSVPYAPQFNPNVDGAQTVYANNNNVGEDQAQAAAQEAVDANPANVNAADDAAFNRDWLDVFYMLSRIVVLFSIVYFYSSPLRFLIVTFLGFAMYLYQGGFFRVQPVLLLPPENNNARPDNENQPPRNEPGVAGAQAAQAQGDAATRAEARTDENQQENEEERPGALAFTWTFFSSFFASLIPDQPNVL